MLITIRSTEFFGLCQSKRFPQWLILMFSPYEWPCEKRNAVNIGRAETIELGLLRQYYHFITIRTFERSGFFIVIIL